MTAKLQFLFGFFVAIVLVNGLCWLLFGRRNTALDITAVQSRLRDDIPGFQLGGFGSSTDGQSAIAEDARDGALYLVLAHGVGAVVRQISVSTMQRVVKKGAALDLRFGEVALPHVTITFATRELADAWEAGLMDRAA